jgi:hypothetical protein
MGGAEARDGEVLGVEGELTSAGSETGKWTRYPKQLNSRKY